MKKIKYLLLFITLSIFSLSIVKADMGVPTYEEFDAIVTAENGIVVKTYEGTKTFKKGDKIKVTQIGDSIFYGQSNGIINKDDIKLSIDEYDLSNAKKLVESKTIKVIAENGIKMYSGPGSAFDEIGTIPNNAEVVATYEIEYDYYMTYYSYVEYNGKKGWIYSYTYRIFSDRDADVSYKGNGSILALKAEIDVYSKPNNKSTKESKTLELDKEYNYSYYVEDFRSRWVYVDELNGWVYVYLGGMGDDSTNTDFLLQSNDAKVLVLSNKDIPVYTSYKGNDKTDVRVSNGTVLSYKYNYYLYEHSNDAGLHYDRYYVNVNGKYGWISSEDAKNILTSESYHEYMNIGNSEIQTYKDFNFKEKAGNISSLTEFNADKFNDYNNRINYYYTSNGEWIKETESSKNIVKNENKNINIKSNVLVYKENSLESDVIAGIKKDEFVKAKYVIENGKIKNDYSYFVYVEYKNVKGWINIKSDYPEDTSIEYYEGLTTVSDEEIEKVNAKNNIKEEDDDKKSSNDKKDDDELDKDVIMYIAIAVAVALAILVIIILSGKNKKSKIQNVNLNDNMNNNINNNMTNSDSVDNNLDDNNNNNI